jgi:L-arginine dehydrogenase
MSFSDNISHNVAPTLLNGKQVAKLLPYIDIKQSLKAAFKSLHRGHATQPVQTLSLFAEDKGDFITYSAAINELAVFGAKLSPYLITSEQPVITAWTYLMSQRTGMPLLCCDSSLLTLERTAATTALAVESLAKAQSNTLAIIGSGSLALAHLRHVLTLRPWSKISVFSPSLATNKAQQDKFKAIYPDVSFADNTSQAVLGADVIMLCTSSATPVIELTDIKAGTLVTSISTNVVNAHEVPPDLLNQSDVYCDYKQTAAQTAGEIKLAINDGSFSADNIRADLAGLVTKSCSLPDYDKPIFFRSTGLGLEDIAIAYALWLYIQVNPNNSMIDLQTDITTN